MLLAEPDKALDYVLGYTCADDVTADLQSADGQWTRAKSFDTFCPLGPWIVSGIDPSNLEISLPPTERGSALEYRKFHFSWWRCL